MFTVILADDEELIRVSLRYLLLENCENVKVIGEAANGEEALEKIKNLHPDILITDIKMPRMDGLTLLKEIREQNFSTKVIILSGYAEFDYARQAMKYGVSDYVLKPVKGMELRDAIMDCIGEIAAPEEEPSAAEKVIAYIREEYYRPLSLEQLAAYFNFSPKYISNLVKAQTGKSYTDYLTDLRISHAVELLVRTNMEIKEIAAAVGYEDQQYFHRIFKKKTGQTPTQYRK